MKEESDQEKKFKIEFDLPAPYTGMEEPIKKTEESLPKSIWKDVREARINSLIFIDIDGMYSYPVRFDGENYISEETGDVLAYKPKKYTCFSEIIKATEQNTKIIELLIKGE